MQKISILITEDHKLFRESLSNFLNSNNLFYVVAECSTGETAVEKVKQLRPDIVIMDINLSGMNGIDSTKQIRKYSPGSKVLGLSMYSHPAYARNMIKAGAMGYVTKSSSYEEFINAILEINAGRKYICSDIKDIISDSMLCKEEPQNSVYSLSGRELEVINEIKKGYSSKEIALALKICVRTVEVHRHNILRKLNLKNTASLVNYMNSQTEFMGNNNKPGINSRIRN